MTLSSQCFWKCDSFFSFVRCNTRCKRNMQIEIPDESPRRTWTLCWGRVLLHFSLFGTSYRKTLFQCSLAFYGRICILSFNKLHLNDFSTRDRKNPNFEHFDQILFTVILNEVIDTDLQLPLICAYAENDLENFIIKVLEMQFNTFMLKNFSQYYA